MYAPVVLFSLFLPVVLAAPPHGGKSHSNKFKSCVAFFLEVLLLWVVSIRGMVSMYRRIRKCAVFSKLHPHLSEGCAEQKAKDYEGGVGHWWPRWGQRGLHVLLHLAKAHTFAHSQSGR